jgi:mannose-6-phosphate isomerase-like protein (cupin superfamily)
LPGATIYIFQSDENLSTGCLRLDPDSSLDKHNRPVEEWLVQIEGESVVKLFEGDEVEEVVMRRGDSLKIPANQYHKHTNVSGTESLTSWHFDGDTTAVINKLRALK